MQVRTFFFVELENHTLVRRSSSTCNVILVHTECDGLQLLSYCEQCVPRTFSVLVVVFIVVSGHYQILCQILFSFVYKETAHTDQRHVSLFVRLIIALAVKSVFGYNNIIQRTKIIIIETSFPSEETRAYFEYLCYFKHLDYGVPRKPGESGSVTLETRPILDSADRIG